MPSREPAPSSPWPAFLCVAAGVFMATLDSSIVTIALPSILTDLGTSLAVVEWVPNAYLVVVTGLLLSCGRLADIYGHRRVFLAGLGCFTAGSVLCALAGGAWQLIAARAVQGCGAAMLMACAPAIITAVFPSDQRGRGIGMVGTTVAAGLTSGPALGGWLLEAWGWRSIFWVNLPVGLLAVVLSARFLPSLRFNRGRQRFDLAGAVLFTAGCGALLLALNRLREWGAAPATFTLAGAGALFLAGFVVRQLRGPEPLLPPELFRTRAFSAAVVAAVLSYLAGFVAILLLPFYLSQVRGLAPGPMGLVLIVPPLVMSLLAPWAGSLSDRVGYGRLTAAGMGLRSLALAALWGLGPATPFAAVVAALALIGASSAVFNPPNTSSIMGSVPPGRLGVAGGVAAVARNLGMVLGISIGGATFAAVFRAAGGTALGQYHPGLDDAFTAGWRAAMAVGFGACVLGLVVSLARSGGSGRTS